MGRFWDPKSTKNGSRKRSQEALEDDTKQVGQKRPRRQTGPLRVGCEQAATRGGRGPRGPQFLMILSFFFFKDWNWKEASRRRRVGGLSTSWPFKSVHEDLLSVTEYNALQTLSIARNYDGIAHAQAEKPKRQIDRDVKIPEQPLYVEGADGTSLGGEGQIERLGDDSTAPLRRNVHLAHHFDQADLDEILAYKTAERTQAFLKELQETGFMKNEELPAPTEQNRIAIRREDLHDRLVAPYEALAYLEDILLEVINKQRSTFGSKVCPATEEASDLDAPPDPDEPIPKPPNKDDAAARFAPSNRWRRPSDYVAYMAKKFEEEWINPRSGKKEQRSLKRDQALFVAQFAQVCSTVWEEDCKVEDGDMGVKKITCFNIL